ncbi:MAG: VanZ family protein [Thermoanaerobaculia bacterium]|nr:VanZ family protein [Thermoanaerobaculia bacterium]
MNRAEPYLRWLPPLVWATLILIFSGQVGGSSTTSVVLQTLLPAGISPETFDLIHLLVRKSGHLLAYGLLGVLNVRALQGQALLAITLAAAVSILDEWHQSYVPLRTGTPIDVVIDVAGAALAVAAWCQFARKAPPAASN